MILDVLNLLALIEWIALGVVVWIKARSLYRRSEDFNCLFCYCPLYTLGDQCGGNFAYIGDGIKDCSNCLLPHGRGSYSYVTGKFGELAELAKKNRKQQ